METSLRKFRFEPHSHTEYSNIRLLDCINHPKDLVNRAISLGLSGIAITDHECLSGHMEMNIYQEEIQKALSIINAKRTEADIKAFNDINKIGDMINLVNYSIRYFGQGMALVLKLRHEYKEANIIENVNIENLNIESVNINNGIYDNDEYREYIEACLESNYYAILSSVINRNERG